MQNVPSTSCKNQPNFPFQLTAVQGKSLLIDAQGGELTSDAQETLLAQRVYQIACGYPDSNDCSTLWSDPAFQAAVNQPPDRQAPLASQPTMTRLENTPSRPQLYRLAAAFVDGFLQSYAVPPETIVLDFDDTDSAVYGRQQLVLFNGYYGHRCYQPLHVYEGLSGKLITTILRPGPRPRGQKLLPIYVASWPTSWAFLPTCGLGLPPAPGQEPHK